MNKPLDKKPKSALNTLKKQRNRTENPRLRIKLENTAIMSEPTLEIWTTKQGRRLMLNKSQKL